MLSFGGIYIAQLLKSVVKVLHSQNLIKINTKIKQKPLYTKLNNFLDESITFDQEKISKIVNISCKLASELDNWFFILLKISLVNTHQQTI